MMNECTSVQFGVQSFCSQQTFFPCSAAWSFTHQILLRALPSPRATARKIENIRKPSARRRFFRSRSVNKCASFASSLDVVVAVRGRTVFEKSKAVRSGRERVVEEGQRRRQTIRCEYRRGGVARASIPSNTHRIA